jgi:hypothetical protein
MPSPRSSHSERSMPGRTENGPSAATCARLTRQRNPVASDAPTGSIATSRVLPPPFDHATSRCAANGIWRSVPFTVPT